MFKLIFSSIAANGLRKIPWKQQDLIEIALDELKEYPYQGKLLKRELTGYFRIRVGLYRIVYKIRKKDKIITILRIDHRSKVYN